MARTLYSGIASTNPSVTAYETVMNALMASLTANIIEAFDTILTDKAPATTRFLRTVVDTDTTGAVVLSSPYLVKAVQAEDEASAIAAMQTFIATIPGYFISPVFYHFSDQMAGQQFRVILIMVYCADAANGAANWHVNGGGGGGGSGQQELVLPAAAGTVVQSFVMAATEAVEIDYVLTKGSVRYIGLLHATHDGAAAYWVEDGSALTPGTVDASVAFDVNGANLRFLATASTLGWTLRYIVRELTTA